MTTQYITTGATTQQDNIIDFSQYRQDLGLSTWPPVRQSAQRRQRTRHARRFWFLDGCASLSVIMMTLAFTMYVLL